MPDNQQPAAPQPDESFLHSLASSAGIDPEAVLATAKAIRQHPWQVAKEVGSAQAGEFVDAGHHLRETAKSALQGVASAITNPEAKAAAVAHLNSPNFIDKMQGAAEYATAAVPLIGSGLVKSEEQAGKGNLAGAAGTLVGTVGPLVTDTEPVQAAKAHLAETGRTFIESAKEGMQRAAVATAPEGSAEAGFAKIPGSKKVRGATPKPTVTSGEDVVTHIQNTAPDKISREEAHQRAGLDSGGDYRLTDIPTANLEAGDDYDPKLAQKYADKKGPLPAIVLDGDGRIRDGNHRVAAAQLRGEPTVKAYVPIDATETAPDKLAAVPGAKFVGKAPSPAEPVSVPAETAADVEKPYQAVEKTPETAASVEKPYHPDLQKVIDLPGVKVHTDPKQVTEAAHFVTPDGKFVRLPAGLDHDAAINTVKPDQTEYDPRINFINDTGAVRIRPTADKGGQNLAVQVPTQGITPEQVDTLKQAVGQGMKSRGNLTLETAAIPTDQKSEYKDVASPRDVEPMLRKIGAHPGPSDEPTPAVPEVPKIAHGSPDEFASAVQNTTGAKLNGKELTVRAERYQKPEQAGSPSIRTGVFYSPEPNSPYSKHYKTGKMGYGGTQRIEGDITFKNPIVAKGASGGKVPERAYDAIQGKGTYEKMRTDVLNAVIYTQDYRSKLPEKFEQNVANVLAKYGADPDNSAYIIEHSKTGNTLPYAIQENIVAHALRAAGHDGIVGYNKIKGQHRLSEIFHITQDTYPEGE